MTHGESPAPRCERCRPKSCLVERPGAGRYLRCRERHLSIYDAVNGISHKVLTETLRRAERDGLITRHLDGERIETATLYELSDLGRSLDSPLAAMAEWADRNRQAVEAARQNWDRPRRANG